ncbi:hypothetical protein VTK56DRAFT_5098 [Thermocarpiscus australiensis]
MKQMLFSAVPQFVGQSKVLLSSVHNVNTPEGDLCSSTTKPRREPKDPAVAVQALQADRPMRWISSSVEPHNARGELPLRLYDGPSPSGSWLSVSILGRASATSSPMWCTLKHGVFSRQRKILADIFLSICLGVAGLHCVTPIALPPS